MIVPALAALSAGASASSPGKRWRRKHPRVPAEATWARAGGASEQSATQTSLISWGWRRSRALVVARSQPQTCLDPSPADTHLHSGNGEGRPGPSLRQLQEPSSVYQPGGTGLALPHSDLSPLARKTVSPVVGRTENVSKGAVTVGSLKTSGIGLGSSMRCLLTKVLCCILLEMENLAS